MSGKIRKVAFGTYQKIDALNATLLKHVLVSPKRAWYHMHHPKDSPTLDFGQAVHAAVFEPVKFSAGWVVWRDGRRAGKVWDAFTAEHASKKILKTEDAQRVADIATAINSHPIAGQLVKTKGRCELTIEWTHGRTGKLCKCRIDKLISSPKILVELKTARNIDPARFATQCAQLGYDVQLSLYADGVIECGLAGADLQTKVIAVEPEPPYDVAVYNINDELLNNGRLKYEQAIDTVIRCKKTNVWPGIAETNELTLNLPGWASADIDIDDQDVAF